VNEETMKQNEKHQQHCVRGEALKKLQGKEKQMKK